MDIAAVRLRNERLVGAPFAKPEDVVRWFGAVQAQDYAGAKWAIGQRVRACDDAGVERAFAAGKIIRTHVMRPTWHFVMPEDLRWMLALTAPRIRRFSAYYDRQHGLDGDLIKRCNRAIAKALAGGKHLTRDELASALAKAGIVAGGPRLGHVMMHAELGAVICSGPRRGKQFTYALVDDWVPEAKPMSHDAALTELVRRYFTSHGPAQAQDFAWWSGLTLSETKRGIELAQLTASTVNDRTYWQAGAAPRAKLADPTIHLLPNYDEYLIAYKDHRDAFDEPIVKALGVRAHILSNVIVMNGKVIGGWRRTLAKTGVTVEATLLAPLTPPQARALDVAVDRFGAFLGVRATLVASKA